MFMLGIILLQDGLRVHVMMCHMWHCQHEKSESERQASCRAFHDFIPTQDCKERISDHRVKLTKALN